MARSSTCSIRRPATCAGPTTTASAAVLRGGTGEAVDLGRRGRDRDGRGGGPGDRRRRRSRQPVPAGTREHELLRAHRLPIDDHRPNQRRDRSARRHRGLFAPPECFRRRRRPVDPGPRQPVGDRDHERPAHHRARGVEGRARTYGRGRADAARDRRPGVVDPRSRRGPRSDRRGGGAAARIRWLAHRPLGRRVGDPEVGVFGGRRDGHRPRLGPDSRDQARPGGRRPGVRRAATRDDPGLPVGRPLRGGPGDPGVHRRGGYPRGDRRAADGRGRPAARRAVGGVAPARRVLRDRGRDAHRARHPRLDRDRQRQARRRARPVPGRTSRGAPTRSAACATSPHGSPPCAMPTRSSRTWSMPRAACSGRTART